MAAPRTRSDEITPRSTELAVVPPAQGDTVQVRIVRRPSAGRVDGGQDRRSWRPRTPLRSRSGTADAHRQRPQVRSAAHGKGCALDQPWHGRALPEPDRDACRTRGWPARTPGALIYRNLLD